MSTFVSAAVARAKAFVETMSKHTIKILGGVGTAFMSYTAWIDPEAFITTAQRYLGDNYVRKVGVGLFALVTLRAWFVGRKFEAMKAQLAAAQAAAPPAAQPPPEATPPATP